MALPSKKLVAGVATAALSAWFSTANAQQNNVMGAVAPSTTEQANSAFDRGRAAQATRSEPWMKAQDFSIKFPGAVGFAVYGRTTEKTNREIVERVAAVLAQCGIAYSEAHAGEADRIGSSIGFYIEGVPFGPKPIGEVMPLIQNVCSVHRDAYPGQYISEFASSQSSGPVVANN